MKINENKVLLLLSGILTGVVISSFIINSKFKPTMLMTYKQYQKMSLEANALNNEVEGLRNELNDLNIKYNKYNTSDKLDKSILDTLSKELEDANIFYGYHAVEGPGVKVTLRDNDEYSNYFEMIDGIIHNTDIYNVINELNAAGAEAITVNGYRIINSSAITCGGPIIMIDDDKYIAPPFEIQAIGDPDSLSFLLNDDQSYIQLLRIRGVKVSIEKSDNIKMNGIELIPSIKNMRPAK